MRYRMSEGMTNIGTVLKEAMERTPRPKEPEQEPVATLDDLEQEIYENTRQFVSRDVMEWMLKRYYTTPPQRPWVGLTDAEIEEFDTWHDNREEEIGWINASDIVAYIEAKLKEKNT